MELKKYKLGELLEIKNGKEHKHLTDGKYPVYGSGGIMRYVNEYIYDEPSVLLPRKGTLNNIQYSDTPFWTVDTLYYTKVKTNIVNPYYLYRYLKLLDLSNLDSGTGVPSMTFDSYYNINVSLPSINEQNQIASILSNYDQKIALNRKINDNLEAMAKQLYDYWFVQFDFPNEEGKPYKSSGGKMVWNEKLKREIPEGWEVKDIKTFAEVKRGSTITKAQTSEGNIKVISAGTSYSFLHNEANRSAYIITVSASGANAGFINFWREPIYASDCSTIQCSKIENTLYCYYWLIYFQKLLFTQQIGAAQPHIYPEHINKIPIVIPPVKIFNKIKDELTNINKQQRILIKQIEALTKQRDELLPLLMNGQVSVI